MSSPTREEATSGGDADRHTGAPPAGAVRPPSGLSREEEAYQQALLEIIHAKLCEQLAKEFPDDERR